MWSILDKLPDSVVGILTAALLWLGAHYLVLADRAMAKFHTDTTMPACLQSLSQYEASLVVPRSGIGRLLGMPELDQLEENLAERMTPRFLTDVQKIARCQCGVTLGSQGLKWDYAVHTASFRLIEPESLSAIRSRAMGFVFRGDCGALPQPVGGNGS